MKQEDFISRAIESSEEEDIDELSMKWLYDVSKEYGNDGDTARKLLDVVSRLLCIYI